MHVTGSVNAVQLLGKWRKMQRPLLLRDVLRHRVAAGY